MGKIILQKLTRDELINLILQQDELLNGCKLCGCCRQYKLVTQFWKRKHSKDGLQNRCIECMRSHYSDWQKSNGDYIKLARRAKSELKKEGKL